MRENITTFTYTSCANDRLSEKDLQVRQQQVQIENLEGKLKEQMRIDSKEVSNAQINM